MKDHTERKKHKIPARPIIISSGFIVVASLAGSSILLHNLFQHATLKNWECGLHVIEATHAPLLPHYLVDAFVLTHKYTHLPKAL